MSPVFLIGSRADLTPRVTVGVTQGADPQEQARSRDLIADPRSGQVTPTLKGDLLTRTCCLRCPAGLGWGPRSQAEQATAGTPAFGIVRPSFVATHADSSSDASRAVPRANARKPVFAAASRHCLGARGSS
jgi:hypothetical protein